MATETVTLEVLWRGVMYPSPGEPFEVRVLWEEGRRERPRLIVLTDDGQLWEVLASTVRRNPGKQAT